MTETGARQAEESPVDLTAELPLDDENVLADPPPSFWRRNRWPLAAVAVVVVAAAIALPLWLTSSSAPPVGLTVTTVTVPVTTGTIQSTVTSSGTIEPASQASLNFAVSGTVTAVDVRAGQTVTAGQTLATIDTTALTEQVNAAQAQLTAANDRLASDEASGASASQIDSDQSSVTSAESSLSTAQTNLSDASLTSTIAGTVASVNLTVGQQVTGTGTGSGNSGNGNTGNGNSGNGNNGNGSGGSGTGSNGSNGTGSSASSSGEIEVIGTDSYIVNTTVDDTQIGQIADGDQAVITPSSSSSRSGGSSTTVYGTVGSISLIGSQSSNVTTFPVVINVTGNPSGLYAGASADVSIIVKQLNNVTEVPTQAISYNSSGQAYVTQVINGAHVIKDVTVGAEENGETQITSGITAGAKVLEREIRFNAPGGGTGILGSNGPGGNKGFPGGSGGFVQRVGNDAGGGGFPVTSGS